jgi:hypothetical protein
MFLNLYNVLERKCKKFLEIKKNASITFETLSKIEEKKERKQYLKKKN